MMTLAQLNQRFATEDACLGHLVSSRWPGGVRCPRCDSPRVHKLAKPFRWQCKQCTKNGYRFSPLVGTIFENTKCPLPIWFQVLDLMCQSSKGISALQIHRIIGSGSYRTAWYMCRRIRAAMENTDFQKLMGVVEVDETYISGQAHDRHANDPGNSRKTHPKITVVGAIARKGNVVAKVISETSASQPRGFNNDAVTGRGLLVATDQAPGYKQT